MTLETYLAIALLHMEQDALLTHEAKIPYRAWASLFWSLIWPFTAALIIAGVVYRQRKPIAMGYSLPPQEKNNE